MLRPEPNPISTTVPDSPAVTCLRHRRSSPVPQARSTSGAGRALDRSPWTISCRSRSLGSRHQEQAATLGRTGCGAGQPTYVETVAGDMWTNVGTISEWQVEDLGTGVSVVDIDRDDPHPSQRILPDMAGAGDTPLDPACVPRNIGNVVRAHASSFEASVLEGARDLSAHVAVPRQSRRQRVDSALPPLHRRVGCQPVLEEHDRTPRAKDPVQFIQHRLRVMDWPARTATGTRS